MPAERPVTQVKRMDSAQVRGGDRPRPGRPERWRRVSFRSVRRAFELSLALTIGAAGAGRAQLAPPGTGGVAALASDLQSLGANRRVLVIGAHPDDEDTDLLALLARGLGVQTAYLSLSRGEGGQDLIGPELGPELGVIRTEELLAARRIDGARQYFSRAYDFGFSKTAAESFRFWPRDSLLADVIAVIRRFRPQVIVSIFSGTPADGHGQHQVAGAVARQAFELLADSSGGPVALYRSARFDSAAARLTLDAGRLDPVTGRSYHQLAMASRSQHRSQEMGQLERAGPSPVRLAFVEWRKRERTGTDGGGLFAGVDTVLHGREQYVALIDSVRAAFNPLNPAGIVPLLARALRALGDASGEVETEQRAILEGALARAAGVVIDGLADDWIVTPGEPLRIETTVWNAGSSGVQLDDVRVVAPAGWTGRKLDQTSGTIAPGALATGHFVVDVPRDAEPSQPYFLRRPLAGALYDWSGAPADVRGLPFEPPLFGLEVRLTIARTPVTLTREVSERHRDEAIGEVRRPVLVDCGFDVAVTPGLVVWPVGGWGSGPRRFTVTVTNRHHGAASARIGLAPPRGWPPIPAESLRFEREDESRSFGFTLTQPPGSTPGDLTLAAASVDSAGGRCAGGLAIIDYPHIRPRSVAHAATAEIRLARVALPPLTRVGYVRGAADRVPEALSGVGVPVELLDADTLARGNLARYDAVVIGSRAYETDRALVANNGRILDYARAGGLVIVQYQQYQFVQGGFAPYAMTIARPHDRVTDESAAVRPLDSTVTVLRSPNRIGPADWEGWVQERGLYFAHEWAPDYRPLLEMHDPGDPPLSGGLLVARLGKGTYVYTGLAFFRQLPAGVPGAYRLFANLLALNAKPAK